MGNNITQRLKYKESVIKFSYKFGVTKAAIIVFVIYRDSKGAPLIRVLLSYCILVYRKF